MDYTEFYYDQLGFYPFDTDAERNQTEKTIQHMIDANIKEEDILKVLEETSQKKVLRPEDLPDWLWEGSLVKRDTFYYHRSLHMTSAPPIYDPISRKEKVSPYYMEMVIQYTVEDLLRYFYRTTRMSTDLADPRKDEGAARYLLEKYSKIPFCESLDFVLALIDEHAVTGNYFGRVSSILGIDQAQTEVYEKMKSKTAEARVHKADRIVWR